MLARKTDESASDVVGDGMVSLPMMPFRVRAEWRLLSFESMSSGRRP